MSGEPLRQISRAASSRTSTPSSVVSLAEDYELFNEALARIAEPQRDVIQLRLIEERSYEDVASTLGRSLRGVQSLLPRARAALVVEFNRLRESRSARAPGASADEGS